MTDRVTGRPHQMLITFSVTCAHLAYSCYLGRVIYSKYVHSSDFNLITLIPKTIASEAIVIA